MTTASSSCRAKCVNSSGQKVGGIAGFLNLAASNLHKYRVALNLTFMLIFLAGLARLTQQGSTHEITDRRSARR